MKRLALLIFAGLALAALAAGCGGGGGTDTTGGGDFTAEANAACGRANQEVAALTPPQGEAQLLPYLEETEAIVHRLHGEIAGLGGSGANAYLAALGQSVTVLNEMSNAARSRNLGAVGEFADQLAALRLARLAEGAGLATCAEAPAVQP